MKEFAHNFLCYITTFALFSTSIVFSQASDGYEYVKNESFSPEAVGLSSGNNTVDHFTGKLTPNIPLYTFKGRELNLPISLNYTADGVRVEEIASYVGLGWNLNFGGRINTLVNGAKDNVNYNDAGAHERDLYLLQLSSTIEYFKMEYHEPKPQLNPGIYADLRVNENSDWIIHMPDGTRYFFEGIQETTQNYKGAFTTWTMDSSYVSSWLLTKVVSPNGLDVYTFTYENNLWRHPIPNYGEGYQIVNNQPVTPRSAYKVNQTFPTAIYHNREKIISFNYVSRLDLKFSDTDGTALKSINLHRYHGSEDDQTTLLDDPSIYRKFVFDYSYFGTVTSNDSYSYLERRLKLDELKVVAFNENNLSEVDGDKYQFFYNQPELVPPITSMAQDYLGLYNGMDNNNNLIDNVHNPTVHFKRKYDFLKSQYGILNKIIYPTKGFSEYIYEQNSLGGQYDYFYKDSENIEEDVDVVIMPCSSGQYCYMCSGTVGHTLEFTANTAMYQNNFNGYPNNNVTDGMRGITGASTTLLTVADGGFYFISTPNNGYGVYLIQSLADLSCNVGSENALCTNSIPYGSNPLLTCLIPLNSIIYNQQNLNPAGYMIGGVTHNPYGTTGYLNTEDSVFLPTGSYQVTLWQYTQQPYLAHIPITPATIRIYKKVTVEVPAHLVSNDLNGTLADGFRIKSITTYSGPTVFAEKREFKYSKGTLFHQLLNFQSGKLTSEGYAYNEAVFYESVSEKYADQSGINFNGHTQYLFSTIEDPVVWGSFGYPQMGLERYSFGMTVLNLRLETFHNNSLKQKKVFDKNGYQITEQRNHYGFGDYTAETYLWPGFTASGDVVGGYNVYEPAKFPVTLSNFSWTTTSKFPDANRGISKAVRYAFEEYADVFYLPVSKHVDYNSHTEDIFFQNETIYMGIGEHYVSRQTIVNFPNYNVGYTYLTGVSSPTLINTIIKNGDINTKVEYIYDDLKNLVTKIQHTPGTITPSSYQSFVYGYSNRCVVASITGVSYADLISWVPGIIDAIKADSEQPVTVNSYNALQSSLKDLRDWLRQNKPFATIVTSTYNPVYGITSVIDQKEQKTTYEYDVFGRQTITRLLDPVTNSLRIVSENTFNTRP